MTRARRLMDPFPLTMTTAWIIGLFSVSTIPLQDLWRPLALALVTAVLLFGLAHVAGRGSRAIYLATAALWTFLIGAWPLALAIAGISVWRLGISQLRRARGRPALRTDGGANVTRVLNALGAAVLAVALVALATSGAVAPVGPTQPSPLGSRDGEPPNMYLILLDGYPAADTLMTEFGYDNRAFERALDERGFQVAAASRSNYNRTLLTLASMLHMEYVDAIPSLARPANGFAAQTRQLTAAINGAPVPRWLADAGYRVVGVSSSYGEAALTSGHATVKTGHLTLFEELLLRSSPVARAMLTQNPEFVAEQHREGVEGTLAAIVAAGASRADEPLFAVAHIFSPHAPFVWNADGSPRALAACYPTSCSLTAPDIERSRLTPEEYGDRLTSQVEHLNRLVLDTADSLISEDPDGVIILFSDHGARYEAGMSAEHFRTIFAARTPGHAATFPDDVSPVNVLPILLNAYFGTDLELREYRAAWAQDLAPLEAAPLGGAPQP